MTKTKKQHYVPQFYLNQFYNNKRLNVFDKKTNKIRCNQSIRELAQQNNFFDVNQDIEIQGDVHRATLEKMLENEQLEPMLKDNNFEKLFSELETKVAPQYKIFIEKIRKSHEYLEIEAVEDIEMMIWLYTFITFQFIRTALFREDYIGVRADLMRFAAEWGDNNGFKNEAKKIQESLNPTRELKKYIHGEQILSESTLLSFSEFLINCECEVLRTKVPNEFITSDAPVCAFGLYNEGNIQSPLLSEKTGATYVLFPLNKNICLKFYRYGTENPGRWRIIDIDNKILNETNSYIASCADRSVFFNQTNMNNVKIKKFTRYVPEVKIEE